MQADCAQNAMQSVLYYSLCAGLIGCLIIVVGVRFSELLPLACNSPRSFFVLVLTVFSIFSLFITPTKTLGFFFRRVVLIVLIIFHLKNVVDLDMSKGIEVDDLTGKTVLITGANSGTGFGAADHFVRLGANLVMACRSQERCTAAAETLRLRYSSYESGGDRFVTVNQAGGAAAVPAAGHGKGKGSDSGAGTIAAANVSVSFIDTMILDLNDLASVKNFTEAFTKQYDRLDILVNNAGIVADNPPGTITKQGLEQSFGVMHIGHFALTKWLLQLIMKPVPPPEPLTLADFNAHSSKKANKSNKKRKDSAAGSSATALLASSVDAARIVNVASAAYVAGSFHPSFMYGNAAGDLQAEETQCGFIKVFGFDLIPCCPLCNCPYTNAYARAKLANVLYTHELQRRIDEFIASTPTIYSKVSAPVVEGAGADPKTTTSVVATTGIKSGKGKNAHTETLTIGTKGFRRVVTASLHPGAVHTNISPALSSTFGWLLLRSIRDAGYIILHAAVSNRFVPGSFIDAVKRGHDLANMRESGHLALHLQSFPVTKKFPYAQTPPFAQFSLAVSAWNHMNFVNPPIRDSDQKGMVWVDDASSSGGGKGEKGVVSVPSCLSASNGTNVIGSAGDGTICKPTDQISTKAASKNRYSSEIVAARLWDVSEQILRDWEKGAKELPKNIVVRTPPGLPFLLQRPGKKFLGLFNVRGVSDLWSRTVGKGGAM